MAKLPKPKSKFNPERANGDPPRFGAGRRSTVTDEDMISAYILGNRRQRRRINKIGALNREFLRDLGAHIVRSKT